MQEVTFVGNIPKFEISNGLLGMDCQSYHLALSDFSMAEQAAIAHAHPVISIHNYGLLEFLIRQHTFTLKGMRFFFHRIQLFC